jgi:hypothetical protein
MTAGGTDVVVSHHKECANCLLRGLHEDSKTQRLENSKTLLVVAASHNSRGAQTDVCTRAESGGFRGDLLSGEEGIRL